MITNKKDKIRNYFWSGSVSGTSLFVLLLLSQQPYHYDSRFSNGKSTFMGYLISRSLR